MKLRNPLYFLFEGLSSFFLGIGRHFEVIMATILALFLWGGFTIIPIPFTPMTKTLMLLVAFTFAFSFFKWRYDKISESSYNFDAPFTLMMSVFIGAAVLWFSILPVAYIFYN